MEHSNREIDIINKLVDKFSELIMSECSNGDSTFDMGLGITATAYFLNKELSFAEENGDVDFDEMLDRLVTAIKADHNANKSAHTQNGAKD